MGNIIWNISFNVKKQLPSVLLLICVVPSVFSQISKSVRGKYPIFELWRQKNFVSNEISDYKLNLINLLRYYGFRTSQINSLIEKNSYILKLDPYEFILPKLLFYKHSINKLNGKFEIQHIDELCDNFDYFSCSLEKQTAPRYAFLNYINYNYENNIKLLNLLKLSDDDFLEEIGIEAKFYFSFRSMIWRGGRNAIETNNNEIIKMLLDCGWNPNLENDRNNRTVLMRACALGKSPHSFDLVKLLIEHREVDGLFGSKIYQHCRIDGKSLLGDNCLHWAATGGSLDIFRFLCELGGNPRDADLELSSPLHWASGSGSLEIVRYLLNNFSDDLNKVNIFGCTPAHFASSGGQLEVCKYLYNNGCDMLKTNYHGHDPLTKAVAYKRNDVASWLLSHVPGVKETANNLRPWNLDTSKSNSENISLKSIARIVGNYDVISLLNKYDLSLIT